VPEGTAADSIIEATDIHKYFGHQHVLRGISLSVRQGQTIVILGPSGSGKSTVRDRLLIAAGNAGVPLAHIGQYSWLSLAATRTIIGLRAGNAPSDETDAVAAVTTDLRLHPRHNIRLAHMHAHVVADRLLLSTACLLALTTALQWAREILGKSPQAQRMLKYSFNLIDDGLVGQQLFAGETTRLAYMTDEAVEGRDAFLQKRPPDWSAFPWYY